MKMKNSFRRMTTLVLAIVLGLTGCKMNVTPDTDLQRYDAQFLTLFDTVTTIVGYAKDKETFSEQVNKLHAELETYHELYDIYNDYDGVNNVKTINDNAGIVPVKVDQKIIDLLKLGKEMYDVSKGEINIAYGSVLVIWHDDRTAALDDPENGKVPSLEELKAAEPHTDINKMIIDEEASTVFLEDPEMSLDVGSLGKGYAVERITDYARENGMMSLLISVGGNISGIGTRGDGADWKVGIQDPDSDSEKAYVKKVTILDKSLVTSGNYQRFYMVDGKKYHHLIDPDTLMPSAYFASVSILTPRSGVADGLSTAVYNMDFESGQAFVESLPDTECMWIYNDGTIKYSSGFEKYLAE